jgi:ABC-2 type transport system permease protein
MRAKSGRLACPFSRWTRYPAIGAISMRARTAYRFDVWLGAAMPFIRVLLAYMLWKALFKGKTLIGGFTLETMTAYYIITAFLARLDQTGAMVWEYAEDIREGRFAKYLAKPVNPFGHFLSSAAARSLYVLGIALFSVVLLALLFRNRFIVPVDPIRTILALAIAFTGLVFMAAVNWLTAVLAFKFKDITGFHMIKGNIVEFLAGTLIPLALLPAGVQQAMRWMPFYYIQYLPASLFLGLKSEEGIIGLLVITGWTAGFLLLGEWAWRILRRDDEGVGA